LKDPMQGYGAEDQSDSLWWDVRHKDLLFFGVVLPSCRYGIQHL